MMAIEQVLQLEYSYLDLPEAFYTRIAPTPVDEPKLVVFNGTLANALGLNLAGMNADKQARLFAGNELPKNAKPFAQAYAGHQFGGFTMLGDGRAHVLGETLTPSGQRFDIQYKGSGPTPYSRRGDGRAVLGPMLREYIISEAMHALGIPTTRSLAVVATGENVYREHPEQGAILTRIAASHLRVGTFEFAAAHQNKAMLQALLDYTLHRHFPELAEADNKAITLLDAVLRRQADLIVHWMRVGFIHGVMNTDNMALSGETIDYGPCAFMDTYDPATVFSSIDHQGRYAYANQPAIALWNLTRFAETLLTVIDKDETQAIAKAEETLAQFGTLYHEKWLEMMRTKLGLFGKEQADEKLIARLLNWMQKTKADYTNTFRDLRRPGFNPAIDATPSRAEARPTPYNTETFLAWHTDWQARQERGYKKAGQASCLSPGRRQEPTHSQRRCDDRLEAHPTQDTSHHDAGHSSKSIAASQALMQQTNPAVIPRNHNVEAALAAATTGDMQPFHALLAALQSPYDDRKALAPYQSPAPAGSCRYQTFCGT